MLNTGYRKLIGILILTSGLLFSGKAFSQQFWQYVPGKTVSSKGLRQLIPLHYQITELNEGEMHSFLNDVSIDPRQGATIELPTPKGGKAIFKICETPVLPLNLQKKYPNIRTFTGVSQDHPYITAKIDFTLDGFHAMIYAPGETWMIDPYSNKDDGYYLVFFQKDAPSPPGQRMICLENNNSGDLKIPGRPIKIHKPQRDSNIAQKESSQIKRTYRLALSCTGEYADAVDGPSPTKAGVLSQMTTTINRVNGIYERELDVTMEFIPDEDDLIYLNPTTDPFTANNNGNLLLGENQQNTDNVVGNNAYDIGHIFSTGGGGVAELTSVCSSSKKAQGVTGMSNPVGDAFAVDYVSHEMGHQFNANHTFNDCNGNEHFRTAYEPGSGSTIMAYAGICGFQNNIQEHSDDYFHAISLTEITNFLDSWLNSCATTEHLNITIPSFPSIQKVYVIPAMTPFELIAPANSNPPSNTLSYCWEQWNLGNLQQPEVNGANFTLGPVFRSSYPKVGELTRVFPAIDSLVKNISDYPGMRFPVVNRYLYFKLTVRHINNNGWGSFKVSDDSLTVQVVNTDTPFRVTEPDADSLTYNANTNIAVTWAVAGTQNTPIRCNNVDIYFSTDSGYTYPYTLATNLPNNGQATVRLPNINTAGGRIKVKGHDNIFFDISNNNFTVKGATGVNTVSLENGLKVFPNPATDLLHIRNSNGGTLGIQLINGLGQRVWKGKMKEELNLSTRHFARGFYLIQFTNFESGVQFTKKLMLK